MEPFCWREGFVTEATEELPRVEGPSKTSLTQSYFCGRKGMGNRTPLPMLVYSWTGHAAP
jgi:hypothetical protein